MTKRKIAVVAALGLSLALVGGIAYASIPGPATVGTAGTIYGCYKTSDGKLSVIDSAASCPSGTTALNWPSGALPGSLYGVHTSHASALVPGDGAVHAIQVECANDPPNSEQVLGAFAEVTDYPDGFGGPGVVRPEAPASDIPNWQGQGNASRGIPTIEFYVRSSGATTLDVFLVCGRIVNGPTP
jgi:hypothetical protein